MKENLKKRKQIITKYFRTAIQILCFLLIPSAFISIFQSMHNIVNAVVNQTGTFDTMIMDILLLVVVTVITGFFGRFFCGWMCAFGSMADFIYEIRSKLSKKTMTIPKLADQVLKSVKYILFFGITIFVWGFQIIQIPTGSNPWDLFGMFLSLGNWPSFSTLVSGWIPAVVILLAIIICSAMIERFFCRYLCPLGAYFSIISLIRPNTILKNRENCGACTLCTKKCSMGIDLRKVDEVHSGECINCMECVSNCPTSNATLPIAGTDAATILAGTASVAMISGAIYLGTYYNSQIDTTSLTSDTTTVEGAQLAASGSYEDGTYEGTGTGFRGNTSVSVTISEGIISEIEITSTNDDGKYIDRASNQMIPDMIATQSSDVDTVSGATYSSNGLIEAVSNALTQAKGGTVTVLEEESESVEESKSVEDSAQIEGSTSVAEISDGTYEGTGTGFRGDTNVTVTVEGGIITDITIESYQDDERFFEQAVDTVIEEIIANQDVTVDAVSGATYSSNGIMGAVADALGLEYTQPEVPSGGGHHRR